MASEIIHIDGLQNDASFDLDDNILQILHLSSGELENIFHPIVEMRQKSATQRSSFEDKEDEV